MKDATKNEVAQRNELLKGQKKAAKRAALIQEIAQEVVKKMVPVLLTLTKLEKHEGYLTSRRISLEADQYHKRDTGRSWKLVEEGEQAVVAIKKELTELVS